MPTNATQMPATGFLRLEQIIGRKAVSKADAEANRQSNRARRRRPCEALPAIVPVSRSTWWDGVASGRYPKPVKIGARATAWRVEDIRALIEAAA